MARGGNALGGALVAGALAAVATGAATAFTARRMVAPKPARITRVLGVERTVGLVRFSRTPESLLPGSYSFWFANGRGHARVGRVLAVDDSGVRRELIAVDHGDLAPGETGRFNGWLWLDPGAVGVRFTDERVQTVHGAVPAWVMPAGAEDRWAVLVHGRASVRQETLRAVPALQRAGWSAVAPAYRGDGEAAPVSDARYGLGDPEWIDVESAILHALDRGAREVVLFGWSSGASIALRTAASSAVASVISSVVLDSPVLDGTQALLTRGGATGLPAPVRRGALSLLTSPAGRLVGADATGLDPSVHVRPDSLTVPVLVLQSDDDGVIAPEPARELAAARPDLVRIVPFTGARHTRLWNLDTVRWEGAVTAWLDGDEAALAGFSSEGGATARRGGPSRRGAARRAAPEPAEPAR